MAIEDLKSLIKNSGKFRPNKLFLENDPEFKKELSKFKKISGYDPGSFIAYFTKIE